MKDIFGTPEAKDLVGRVESRVNDVVQRVEKGLFERLDVAVPRALGSQPVRKDDEFKDYLLTIADTPDPEEAAVQRITEWAQQYGWPKARTMFVEYVERNEQRLMKMAEEVGRDVV